MKERKKENVERQKVWARVRKITKDRKEKKRKKIIKMMIVYHCVIYLCTFIYLFILFKNYSRFI